MPTFPISGYQLRLGSPLDRALLVKFMERNYTELGDAPPPKHLATTVDRYLSCETPLWLVEGPQSPKNQSPGNQGQANQDRGKITAIACIWLGQATDQQSGLLHPYVLLLYVQPDHRRRGIATALLETAHQWAQAEGHSQISLQVFSHNQAAQALYEKLGYQSEAILMKRGLGAKGSKSGR